MCFSSSHILKKRVAFEKMTHYGPGYTVVVRADPVNISHTHHRIFFHTDLTYYDYMPGVGLIMSVMYIMGCISRLCSCTVLSSMLGKVERRC